MFKLVHYLVYAFGKQVVGFQLKCLLIATIIICDAA